MRREGAVNYLVGTEDEAGERQIRRHANQLKLRHISAPEKDNVLLDMFDLPPSLGTYESLIIPHQNADGQIQEDDANGQTQEDDTDESLYEDAQQPAELEEEASPRRSERAAAVKSEGSYKHFF